MTAWCLGNPIAGIVLRSQSGDSAVRIVKSRPFASRRTGAFKNNENRIVEAARHEICEIYAYPLGIVCKRPYDGGLSFSAQMKFSAENGV